MNIREATADDWAAIWPFFHRIVAEGATYTLDPDTGRDAGRQLWMQAPPGRTTVAVDDDGTVLGTAKISRNQQGPGAHVANGSYMVAPEHRGRGVARALCEDSLERARAAGFRGMQFNAVVETNEHAVRLYESLGFHVVGTVPGGFHHPQEGYVGLHVMYRAL